MSVLAPSPRFTRPTVADVITLPRVHSYPCISILLNTKPQVRMDLADRARLSALLRDAERRLQREAADSDLVDRLRSLANRLVDLPTDSALALFAADGVLEFRHLPRPVEERVVIDPTFATRDVIAAVQENPPYLLVVVDSDSARLLRARDGVLAELTGGNFPMRRGGDEPVGARPGRRRGDRPSRHDARSREQLRAFLRQVDRAVSQLVAADPQPVVVMAGDRVLSEYLQLTRLGERIIAFARSAGSTAKPGQLEKLVRPLLRDHLLDLAAAAQDTMTARLPGREVVTGLASCWHAASAEQPELLLVEQSFAMPARLSGDDGLLRPATDREHPEVFDDAIDELVELVLARGGQVRFVPDGSLADQERIALRVLMPLRRHASV